MAAEHRTAEATPNTGSGELPPKRSRSLRRLLPGKHGISASPTSIQPPESGRFPSGLSPAQRPRQPPYHNVQNGGARPILQLPPRSSSNDSYYSTPGPASHSQNIRPVPSEAARLRSLNSGQHSPINPEPRYKSETPPQLENFSRPRKISIKGGDERPRLVVSPSFSYPLQTRSQTPTYTQRPELREGGLPDSTSLSTNFVPSRSLRNSSSIPEHIVEDPPRSVSSNSMNFRHAPGYGDTSPNYRRDQNIKLSQPGEELRESFRSVQTTGTGTTWMTNTTATTCATTPSSSFLEASGTERSSVVSKYSTASMNGRDQIDDFLDMYEDGFAESGNEDGSIHRPPTIRSVRSVRSLRSIQDELGNQSRIPNLGADNLPIPKFSNLVIRDSAEMFRNPGASYMDPFNEGNSNGTPNSHVNTSTSHQPQSSQRPPTSTTLRKFSISRRVKTQPLPSSPRFDPTRDRYGFKKMSQYISLSDYENWNVKYVDHLARRKRKWVALMKETGLDTENPAIFPPQSTKTKRFIRKGIPPDWRGEAWFWYAGGHKILADNPKVFANLVRRAESGSVSSTDEEIIERDLHRTFPDNILFKPDPAPPTTSEHESGTTSHPPTSAAADDETPMLKSLRRVLQATSIYNPKIGYCQSLNFLAGLLLLFMDEERAFWMLDIITKSYLPGTHEVSLEGANVDLGVLVTSIKESMPGIWAKIGGELDGSAGGAADDADASRLPPITLCCTAWFMSCFIGTLPVETTLRVWDAFFYEGSKTLFRIALAVFKVGEPEIRAVADPMEIFQVVQTIPRRLIDANALMDACFRRRNGFGHLTQGTIDERRAERRRGYADARAVAAGRRPASSRKGRMMFSALRTRKSDRGGV